MKRAGTEEDEHATTTKPMYAVADPPCWCCPAAGASTSRTRRSSRVPASDLAPRLAEVGVVRAELATLPCSRASGRRASLSRDRAGRTSGRGADEIAIVVLCQRDRVLGDEAGDPRRDRGAIELLVQQHRALPRLDALRRHELDRGQFGHLAVGHHADVGRRCRIAGRRWQRSVRGVGGATGEHLVATGASCRE